MKPKQTRETTLSCGIVLLDLTKTGISCEVKTFKNPFKFFYFLYSEIDGFYLQNKHIFVNKSNCDTLLSEATAAVAALKEANEWLNKNEEA